jgi:drug/metabolite transporter (DMT)-like permease
VSSSFETAGLSLLSAASWGGGDFAGGLAVKRANVFRVVALAHAFGFVLMLSMALSVGETIPPVRDLAWGAIAGVTGAFGIAALYKGLAVGRMGIIAPVASVVTAIIPVVVALRTEGLPTTLQLAGFVVALVSIWLVARPDGQIDTHRGLGLAILAGVSFGLFLVSGKEAGHHAVFWPMVAARFTSSLLMGLIAAFTVGERGSVRSVWVAILASGLLDSCGNALFIAASRHGRLDVAAVLSSLYPASTVILARVLLKERISRLQAVGIIGALLSVTLISGG